MLTYSFEDIGSESLYEHLYKCIKHDIITGELVSGEHLPSKRKLAAHLGISSITIENAYSQLLAEGYIQSIPRKGYFVSDIAPDLPRKSLRRRVKEVETEPERDWYADFKSNATSPEAFPFPTWARLMREVIAHRQRALLAPSPSTGIFELRKAISNHLRHFRGLDIPPSQIIVGAGSEYLYSIIVRLLGTDKLFCLEDPGYLKVGRIYEANGARYVRVPVDDCGMRVDALRSCQADVAHLSPSHQFPTGIVMPVARRYELLGWAMEEKGRYVVEDDYDSEFRMSGRPVPTLTGIDAFGRVIYLNTFSKSLSPTIRISYMVLPAELMRKYEKELGFLSCTVSNFEQYTLTAFIEGGFFERHLNRMRVFYRRKRDILCEALLKSDLGGTSRIVEQESGLHFRLDIPNLPSDEAFVAHCAQKGVRIASLADAYRNRADAPAHAFLVNYSSLTDDRIPEAVKRLSDAYRETCAAKGEK